MAAPSKADLARRIRQLGGCLPVSDYTRWTAEELRIENRRLVRAHLLAMQLRVAGEAPTAAVTHPARQADTDPGTDVPPAFDPGRPETARTTTGKV